MFAAAGIDADREEITRRARRWRFTCPAPDDSRTQHAAVAPPRASCAAHAAAFPGGEVPDDPAQLAVLAVRVADVFLPGGSRRRRHRGRHRGCRRGGRRGGGRMTAYAFMTAEPEPRSAPGWRPTLATLRDDVPADVPCGACNACCRTFHQLHIRPGEKRARKRLPKEYFSAPRDCRPATCCWAMIEDGACPVLVEGRCTIYEDRPLVCRTYDCRLYAATGVEPDRAEIAEKVRRWSFSYPAAEDRERQEAVLAAVRFIRETPACLPGAAARRQPIRLATLAVIDARALSAGRDAGPAAAPGRRPRPGRRRHQRQ